MDFGRELKTKAEKDFWKLCYKIGMKNGWCSGRFAMEDGDFIVEEDRLNKHSVMVVDNLKDLRRFFAHGNWCLGFAVIYKNLCFMQQVNGGDEWLTIRKTAKGAESFESITFGPMARNYRGHYDAGYLDSTERKENGEARLPASHYEGKFEKYVENLSKLPDERLHCFEQAEVEK